MRKFYLLIFYDANINKQVSLIEKGRSDIPAIREFRDWLIRTNDPPPPYDSKATQRYKAIVFEPGTGIYHTTARYPREVGRLDPAVYHLD